MLLTVDSLVVKFLIHWILWSSWIWSKGRWKW